MAVQSAAQVRQQHGQHVLIDQRRDERLGGSHADLRSGLHGDVTIRQAHGLRADGVDNAPKHGTFAASLFHGRQSVRGLARLADRQQGCALIDDRIAVAQFGGDRDLHGNARNVLDQVLAHHARVGGGAAGCDDDAIDLSSQRLIQMQIGQPDAAVNEVDAARQRVGHGARLFVDLLLHEVPILALLCRDRIPGHIMDFRLDCSALERFDANGTCGDDGQLSGFKKHDPTRVLHDRRRIARDEVLAVAEADDHAAGIADARRDDLVRLIRRNQHHDVGALDLQQGTAGGFDEIRAGRLMVFHHVDDGFGVGLGLELHAFGGQLILELQEVLDDAVVHDDNPARLSDVRVSISGGRRAMRGPTRVPHAWCALDGRTLNEFYELRKLAGVFADLQRPACTTARPAES